MGHFVAASEARSSSNEREFRVEADVLRYREKSFHQSDCDVVHEDKTERLNSGGFTVPPTGTIFGPSWGI